ncbi:hypothetical protein KBB08_02165 [Candidatus Gracilibacteria bacterium]|nr:hypothetical protein [Candidatus Gracilibacteria bacterium]
MLPFKKFTFTTAVITVLYCLWTWWFLTSGELVFFGNAYLYTLTATALFLCFLLAKIVSNHSYLLKMLLVSLPYVGWCVWLSGTGIEQTSPGLFTILLLISIAIFMIATLVMSWDVQTIDADLLAKGERAPAQVLAIADNGMTVNENQFSATLTLSVRSQSLGEFPVTCKQLISRLHIPKVGEQVMVLFDPNNLKTMMLLPPGAVTATPGATTASR